MCMAPLLTLYLLHLTAVVFGPSTNMWLLEHGNPHLMLIANRTSHLCQCLEVRMQMLRGTNAEDARMGRKEEGRCEGSTGPAAPCAQ